MAGILHRLRQPGEAARILAPARDALQEPVIFEHAPAAPGSVRVAAGLRGVSAETLRSMIDLLKREEEARKTMHMPGEEAVHGTSR